MAYFRQCFPNDSNISTIKELAHSLASHCPYEVPIASIKIQHLHREVPGCEIFYSLNASIVGLAVDSEGPENLPWCLGLGIVRGIDTVKGVLYVITPVPHSSLEKVNLLLQARQTMIEQPCPLPPPLLNLDIASLSPLLLLFVHLVFVFVGETVFVHLVMFEPGEKGSPFGVAGGAEELPLDGAARTYLAYPRRKGLSMGWWGYSRLVCLANRVQPRVF
ncbi:polynucleotide 5-hydroxyl-kinase NOL9 isoform X1 [Sesbania bispinosa]|nr:polynucleotide 5-hydroxyl-kinase NOL9 isoform X1 [Sesbania bispinosa]